MKYNTLGNSGLVVSELALGTMTFGTGDYYGLKFTFDQKASQRLLDRSIEEGINFIDTADMYGNGETEEILGKIINGKREDLIIATKSSFRSGPQAFNAGVNAKHLYQQAQSSLKKLNTDYLDVLLLHNDDPITPIDETLRAMENLVQSGMVRYIGFSNYQAWKASSMIQLQKDLRFNPFVVGQMHYSLLNREVESEVIPMMLHHGVGMMVWSPLSSGFLTGKYTRENPDPTDARLNTFDLGLFDREHGYTVLETLQKIALQHETNISSVAISWLLSKKVVSSVIIGVSKEEQLSANIDSTKINLTTEEIKVLDDLTAPIVKYPKTFQSLQDPILISISK